MFRLRNIQAMGVSLLAGLFVSIVVVSLAYMQIHDFGRQFLNAGEDDAFWKAALTLFLTLSLIIYLIWGSKAIKSSDED